MEEREKLYKPEEVAEILNMSPQTIRHWLRDGEIRGVKLPRGRWRIPESELNRLLPKQE